jgi:hypothetical protein
MKALAVLLELKDFSNYWSEYTVPIGIHERIDEADIALIAYGQADAMLKRREKDS